MNKILLACLLSLVSCNTLVAKKSTFVPKLFKNGDLLYSDDFNNSVDRGRYGPNKGNIKLSEPGVMQVLPLPRRESKLTVMHIHNVPKQFVCHFRYSVVTKMSSPSVGFQIGGHEIHVNGSNEGYSVFLRDAGKKFVNNKVEGFKSNTWIEVIIEYKEGTLLLNINGQEKIFKHNKLSMDDKNSIVFKNPVSDQILFDYIRLWDTTKK
jgi:hypothetical protein